MTSTRLISSIRLGRRHRRDLGDVDQLSDSIGSVGLLHPVVIAPDGTLIAGERRLQACKALGWTHVPVTVVELDQIVRGEFAENSARKDFTLSEAVAVKRTLEPLERAAAKERMLAGKTPSENFSEGRGNALDKIARVVGKHRTTLAKAEAIVAAAEAEPERYGSLLSTMDKTGRVNAPFRRLNVLQQADALRREVPPLPGNGPYRVGMIDIPWAYEPDDDSGTRGVLPYATLSIKQACALDIDSIMHADAVLFMWVTNFILARGLHLEPLTAWRGFEPKTIITWPKDRHTFKAHWLRGQTEHMVMAVRGRPVIDLTAADQSTLLHGPFHLVRKGKHSAKPVEAYGFVERLCPAPRYADIFSRYRHNDKWDCHGDEAPVAMEAAQ